MWPTAMPARKAPAGAPAAFIETVIAKMRPCRRESTAPWRIENIAMMNGAEHRPDTNMQAIPSHSDDTSGTSSSGSPNSAVKTTTWRACEPGGGRQP